MEIWKDIIGYEELYQVSNLGRVKSLYFGKEIYLKDSINSSGYKCVVLYKNGKKSFTIHSLVANHFVENIDNLPIINHIDENKVNNHFQNLEWCTNLYNINYGNRNKRVSTSLSKKVVGTNIYTNESIIFESSIEAEKYGFDGSSIRKCCNGKRNTHKGYTWRIE